MNSRTPNRPGVVDASRNGWILALQGYAANAALGAIIQGALLLVSPLALHYHFFRMTAYLGLILNLCAILSAMLSNLQLGHIPGNHWRQEHSKLPQPPVSDIELLDRSGAPRRWPWAVGYTLACFILAIICGFAQLLAFVWKEDYTTALIASILITLFSTPQLYLLIVVSVPPFWAGLCNADRP